MSLKYDDNILFLGSCFAEHISDRVAHLGFRLMSNPTGVLYNPISIWRMLKFLNGQEQPPMNRFLSRDNYCLHFDFHSSFFHEDPSEFLSEFDGLRQKFQGFWAKAPKVFLTLGSSWIYEYDGNVVANCHKQALSQFNKRILSVSEIVNALQSIIGMIKKQGGSICFTISPVRHLRDGMIENQRSKAHLHTAVHHVLQEGVTYFPSYEIMMDDLRDYRFYADDLLHPSIQAVEYIGTLFEECFFEKKERDIMDQVRRWRVMQKHRPLFPKSEAATAFKAKRVKVKEDLLIRYPFLQL